MGLAQHRGLAQHSNSEVPIDQMLRFRCVRAKKINEKIYEKNLRKKFRGRFS